MQANQLPIRFLLFQKNIKTIIQITENALRVNSVDLSSFLSSELQRALYSPNWVAIVSTGALNLPKKLINRGRHQFPYLNFTIRNVLENKNFTRKLEERCVGTFWLSKSFLLFFNCPSSSSQNSSPPQKKNSSIWTKKIDLSALLKRGKNHFSLNVLRILRLKYYFIYKIY